MSEPILITGRRPLPGVAPMTERQKELAWCWLVNIYINPKLAAAQAAVAYNAMDLLEHMHGSDDPRTGLCPKTTQELAAGADLKHKEVQEALRLLVRLDLVRAVSFPSPGVPSGYLYAPVRLDGAREARVRRLFQSKGPAESGI